MTQSCIIAPLLINDSKMYNSSVAATNFFPIFFMAYSGKMRLNFLISNHSMAFSDILYGVLRRDVVKTIISCCIKGLYSSVGSPSNSYCYYC